MYKHNDGTMIIEKYEAHDTVELETNDYLIWLAREKQKINAIKSAYIIRHSMTRLCTMIIRQSRRSCSTTLQTPAKVHR